MTGQQSLLVTDGLTKVFGGGKRFLREAQPGVQALSEVTLEVSAGETVGIVGETGCGKSTFGRVTARLIDATQGEVWFEGKRAFQLDGDDLSWFRRRVQLVFQDPFLSLNPRAKIITTIREPLDVHRIHERRERDDLVYSLLERVGLRASYGESYPHELSGGMRQRVGIARALASDPSLVICDEPVSALDVSIQSQVLNLLLDLQAERALTYLFITHDLTVARLMSDRIVVMYLGRIVELAPTTALFRAPRHPYTQALLSAIPLPNPKRAREQARDRVIVRGEMPNPSDPPPGCAFQTRCPEVMDICRSVRPPLARTDDGHYVACHLHHPDPTTHELPIYEVSHPEPANVGSTSPDAAA
jgi:oligopeptide/dipeptide ABC transporter ATP-binding protein